MRLFRSRRDETGDLGAVEKRLRAERPQPRKELVERLVDDVGGHRGARGRPTYSLQIAAGMSALVLAAVVALGGLASPLNSTGDLFGFEQSAESSAQGPATDQYGEDVTICDRSDSGERTIRVSRETADALLSEDPRDSEGPCPAPAPGEVVVSGDSPDPGDSPDAASPPDTLPLTGFGIGLLAIIGIGALVTGLLGRRATRD